MDNNRYISICSEFDVLLKFGVSTSIALANKEADLDREYYADRIFSKLLCHAITLKKIIPTGLVPLGEGSTELWDISSAAALSRSLIESFDALSYVSIEEIDNHEREFRVLLWKLHSEERRSKMLELIGSNSPEIVSIKENIIRLREEVITHKHFSELDNGRQKKIRDGDSPAFYLSHAERNKRASVNHKYYNACIIFLSSYVHTYPFSIHQLMEFRAGNNESLRLMSMPIQYSIGFFAKALEGLRVIFGSRMPNMTDEETNICLRWCEILKRGISNIG